MKFVCERCQTKYSIADEKVRGKVLKVRCKSCSNVITVREQLGGAVKGDGGVHDSGRTAITSPAELQRRHAEATRAMEGARVQATQGKPRSGPLAAIPAEALNAPGTPKAPPPAVRPPAPSDDPIWYLAVDGNQTGPFTASQLADKVLGQPKTADVHVWNAGLGDWRPPSTVPEIHSLVEKRKRPAPPPPPPMGAPRRGPSVAPPLSPTSTSAATPVISSVPMAASPMAAAPTIADKHASPARPHALPGGRPSLHRVEAARLEPILPTDEDLDEILNDKPAKKTPHGVASQNGLSAHADAHTLAHDLASPSAALSGGESDALNALTLSPAATAKASSPAPAATHLAQSADTMAEGGDLGRATASEAFFAKSGPAVSRPTSELIAGVARRHRNVKLVFGLAAVVVVVCSVLALSTMRKPGNLANAEKPKVTAGATDFAELARKLAEEEGKGSQGTNAGSESPSTEPKTVTVVGRPPPRDPRRMGHTPPTRGILAGSGTAPPPLSDMSPDQKKQAERMRIADERLERPIAVPGGSSSAKSTPAQGDIVRVINNNKAGIQTCYQRALLRDPSLKHGKLNVRLTIGLSGKVKNVGLEASTQFRALEPCIREVVQRWAFPPSSDEYGTEFPVLLQGAE